MTSVRVFEVGGCVRDRILGVKPNDIDFAVEAESFEAMFNFVKATTKSIFLSKPEFLTIRALTKDNQAVDFVLCRKDGIYSDGRRPDSVEPGSIEDDLMRRDLTINAVAMDSFGNFIDPHGGIKDIEAKLLRCVGNTEDRFNEDALRILRAMRFSITKGFSLHSDIEAVFSAPEIWIPKLASVSRERIRDELMKCMKFSTPDTLRFLRSRPIEWTETLFSGPMWLEPSLKER